MTKDIVKAIKESLSGITTVYHAEAPQHAEYPYAEFSIDIKSQSPGVKEGTLEVNVWDMYQSYARADADMDSIEEALTSTVITTDKEHCALFAGVRGHIPDTTPGIRRVRAVFDLFVYN